MSYYPINSDDLQIISQNEKIITVSIELLDSSFKTLQMLDASLISLSLSIDANSETRRTGSLNVFPEFDGYELTKDSVFWIDRYLRIYLTFHDICHKKDVSYCMGTFLVDTKTFDYSNESDSLSITLLDLCAKLDGTYDGELPAEQSTVIEAGSPIRDAMIRVFDFSDITNYVIDDIGSYENTMESNKVPYDITIDGGTNILEVIKQLRDLYVGWETYVDVYGTFHCNKIPTCENDSNTLTTEIFDNHIAVYSENRSYSFQNIRNVVQVYGEEFEEQDRFADEKTSKWSKTSPNILEVEIPKYMKYENGDLLAVKLNKNNPRQMMININELGNRPVVISEGKDERIPENYMIKDATYILRYENYRFVFLSSFQPTALSVLTDCEPLQSEKIKWYEKYHTDEHNTSFIVERDNPFTVEKIGVKYTKQNDNDSRQVIQSDLEALNCAEYWIWKKARVVNDITITCDIIPFLDVNQKFTYRHRKSGEEKTYITKSINIEISETNAQMTITASTFNEEYPNIISIKERQGIQ